MRHMHRRKARQWLLSIAVSLVTVSFSYAQSTPPIDSPLTQADAVRLLEQSTFGPTQSLVSHVMAIGLQAYLAEQFAAAPSQYPALKYVPSGGQATFCATDPDVHWGRDYYTMFLLQNAFFENALNDDDQLRQRVAFALSQILVTSGLSIHEAYGMANYQQLLLDNAFGNYEDILTKVTLSPVMGDYLNMVDNDKAMGAVEPNENYAREVLQLFSIGVWELNKDGIAAARQRRSAHCHVHAGQHRWLCQSLHRMDVPGIAGDHGAQSQPEKLSRTHGCGGRRS